MGPFYSAMLLTSPLLKGIVTRKGSLGLIGLAQCISHATSEFKVQIYIRAVALLSNVASSHEDGSAGYRCDPMEGWAVNRLMLFSESSLNFFVVCAGPWGVGAGTF